ncbi:hypothetical protein [Nocardioides sediminis]|uniref:hypothetical protein n=1 Tax=Nocardioides sediminis TaxID=433648 RepID=UPI00131EE181|nr:hypothetical protein [Nocardioides sediminis]
MSGTGRGATAGCGAGPRSRALRGLAPVRAVLALTALHAVPADAAPRPGNGTVAARIAADLRCESFAYRPGPNAVSSSDGLLTCRTGPQDFTAYVFDGNRARDRGVAHVRLWSGPGEVHHFVRDHRAVIAPEGGASWPAYGRRWARVAARRTGGVVFSG